MRNWKDQDVRVTGASISSPRWASKLFRVRDQVAAEVVEAHAQLESAAVRMGQAELGLNKHT